MDFKSMLQHLSQLSEGTQETEKGKIHRADPGGYGRKFDTDDEGDEKKDDNKHPKDTTPKKRGRPSKTGEYSTSPEEKEKQEKREKAGQGLQSYIVGNLPKNKEGEVVLPGKASKKHTIDKKDKKDKKKDKPAKKNSLKEWVQEIEAKYIAEEGTMPTTTSTATASKPGQKVLVKPGQPSNQTPPATITTQTGQTVATGPADQVKKLGDLVNTGQVTLTKPGTNQPLDEEGEIVGSQPNYNSLPMVQRALINALDKKDENTIRSIVFDHPDAAKAVITYISKGGANIQLPQVRQRYIDAIKKHMDPEQVNELSSRTYSAAAKAAAARGQAAVDQFGDSSATGKEVDKYWNDRRKKFDNASRATWEKEQLIKTAVASLKGMSPAAARKYINNQVTQGKMNSVTAQKVLAQFSNPVQTEADAPPTDSLMSTFNEGAKPDFPDIDNDGNEREPISKAAKDAEKKPKKKVSESVHRHSSARLLGKSHALAKEGYNCKFDDMEEARMYHEGFKEGLDECYGQMPVQGLVSENPMPATTPGMASAAMSPAMDEGNDFTEKLARTPHGGQFKVGGNTYTDTSDYDSDIDEALMAFESWDKELNDLLNEGMSVSISQGQQGMPDSVSVTAQDGEAEQLLNIIKQAGLGLFGGEQKPEGFAPEVTGMSVGGEEEGRDPEDIGVVDDHDGMMALIKKVLGGEQQPEEVGANSDEGHDYEGEEHDHSGHEAHDHEDTEESCNECGMLESNCECDKEEMDEDESYPQEEYEVAEDNAPDSDAAETTADENAEAAEDSALAKADELNEWANDAGKKGTDESFESDIAFMTKVIAGGLNKEKATGQTTIPVIAGQNDRMGYSATNESIADWRKLAGLK
jgi:hypothetical protein